MLPSPGREASSRRTLAVVELEEHRLVVRGLRLGIDGDGAHARQGLAAHEDEIAAVGRLGVRLRRARRRSAGAAGARSRAATRRDRRARRAASGRWISP